MEVYTFIINNYTVIHPNKGLRLKLLLSENLRHTTRSKLTQLIVLLHKLENNYLKRIDANQFPALYKKEIESLQNFLSGFRLTYYDELIREQSFNTKHLVELTKIISAKANKGEFKVFWKQYFLFEAYLSISKGIDTPGFSFPTFNERQLSLEDLYHPLIKNPVKNSLSTENNVILFTGPNMSGKSTFLKAAGLCIYLGHIGLAVPASKAEMPYFDSISTSINLSDDLLHGYSHFMAEIMTVKKVVIEASGGRKCFSVFDELFRGTNIEDAVEISSTTLKGLCKFKNCLFFISTHLHPLKEIKEVGSGAISTYYFDCALVNNTPIFSYILKKGWSDIKVGQILFEKEGLNTLLNQL